MRKFIFYLGLVFMLFGLFGGHKLIASRFSWSWFNQVTKDQVTCIFGFVFALIGFEKEA